MTHFPPGSTIGILGGGQLGRMMAMAAAQLGYHVHIFTPEVDAPAREVAKHCTVESFENRDALLRFARSVDVVTYEFENIPVAAVEDVARHTHVFPDVDILRTCQHRILEKTALNKLGIATAPFAAVTSDEEYRAAIKQIGVPAVLKTAMMGYDGKGQWKVKAGHPRESGNLETQSKLPEIPGQAGDDKPAFILESFVDFTMEISVIVARDHTGNIACYPPVQNKHENHILAETIVPAPIADALSQKAERIARNIAEGLKLVGIMAVEMFVVNNGEILVNELAPRPHNSGHWTIDACTTSQFEQVIRAICGLPLGSTDRLCDARMINLIGDAVNDWEKYIAEPNAKLHLYGKKETRPGRKMGHVTILSC